MFDHAPEPLTTGQYLVALVVFVVIMAVAVAIIIAFWELLICSRVGNVAL